MTVATEQYDVSYKGTGVANDTYPIPFSFRHTDILKVDTIDANGTKTQRSIDTHYDVIQLATSNVSGDSNVISSNSQRTEYGWIKYKTATTDIIRIYKEETFVQDYDYVDTTAIPAEQFTKSADRIVDATFTQITRSHKDPTAFDAQGKKITSLSTPTRNDDILSKTVLDSMGTSATLTIPASGGAGDNGKLLCPSGFAPGSTPAVAWASRLGLPSSDGGGITSNHVLSPVSDYANSPFVEWTLPRWITAPPNDGLQSVYNYGTGTLTASEVEGEGTSKHVNWRQLRPMPSTLTTTADVNKVIKLNSTTWTPLVYSNATVNPEVIAGPYSYELPNEPPEGTENSRNLRMVAGYDGAYNYSPRIKLGSLVVSNHYDGSGSYPTFGDGDGTFGSGSTGVKHTHPYVEWTYTNVLKDDSDNLVMPQMVLMQVQTNAYTVEAGAYGGLGGVNTYTAYPVYFPSIDPINNINTSNVSEFIEDATPTDGTANNTITGRLYLANVNQYARSATDGLTSTSSTSDESHYLDFSSAQNATIHFLLIYGDTGGVK